MVPTFAWEEHATLTLPLRTAGRLVEGLKCSSGGGGGGDRRWTIEICGNRKRMLENNI